MRYRSRNVFFVKDDELNEEQTAFVHTYFNDVVRPKIFPIMLTSKLKLPELKDGSIYLAVNLKKKKTPTKSVYSIIKIPSDMLPRFIILPSIRKKQYVILLDDIIRYGLKYIYTSFNYTQFDSYCIKLTRDAELDIDDDIGVSYLQKITKSLKKREQGDIVRFNYDETMPAEMLNYFLKKLKLQKDDTVIPGGRYHNFKDFMKFPDLLDDKKSHSFTEVGQRYLHQNKSVLSSVKKHDILLNFPYQSFDWVIDLLREASIDPKVSSIKITLYRVAKYSSVVNALMTALKNGKEVVVLLELQARFDEKANIEYANMLQEEGATVIFGIEGLKVHSKLLLITRREKNKEDTLYCCIELYGEICKIAY